MKDVKEIARLAKEASVALGSLDSAKKNLILTNIAKALREETDTILAANQEDINISISNNVSIIAKKVRHVKGNYESQSRISQSGLPRQRLRNGGDEGAAAKRRIPDRRVR